MDSNVDGEMGVDALHFVTISVGHALHHVLNMTDDGSHCGDVFAVSEPFLALDSVGEDRRSRG